MPRIKQLESKYATEDFQKAIFTAMVANGMECSVRKLATSIGVGQSCLNTNLRHTPQNLTVGVLQKIVKKINPDIQAMLALLGYTTKQINTFRKGE